MNKTKQETISLGLAENMAAAGETRLRRKFFAAASAAVIASLGCGSSAMAQSANDARPKADSQLPPVQITAPAPKRRANSAPAQRADRGAARRVTQSARKPEQ